MDDEPLIIIDDIDLPTVMTKEQHDLLLKWFNESLLPDDLEAVTTYHEGGSITTIRKKT